MLLGSGMTIGAGFHLPGTAMSSDSSASSFGLRN